MKVILEGNPKEIAALVLAVQERRAEDVSAEFSEKLHQEIQNRLEAAQGCQESR